MRVSKEAVIRTDFPDDTVWLDDDVAEWGGKNVTVAVREILTRLGASVSEPILEDNGWALNIEYKGRHPWCLIHDGGDGQVYFYMEDRWGARGNPAAYVELIVLLNAELHRDLRFNDIRWSPRGRNRRHLTWASPVGD